MSYEYKDIFIESLSNFIYPGKIFDDSLSELDHVYEQAAKADEYEVKAKAWDKYKTHMESHIAGEINEEEFVSDLKSDYFESGESDESTM